MSGRKCRIVNRYSMAAIALAVSSVTSAYGQTAYYSLSGTFSAIGDKHDFGINLSSGVTSAETFKFVTYAHTGGINAAGVSIGAGGIDSFLELVSVFGPSMGSNDDGGSGLDSLLSWPGLADSGGTLSSPIGSGPYTLKLNEFNNDANGNWQVDLIGPASKMSMNRITKTGTSSVFSFRFGTSGAGTDSAVFNYDGFTALAVANAFTVGQTGNAVFNHNAPSNGATANGVTTINSGGTFNLIAGTFTANDNINVASGKLIHTGGTLALASGKAITISGGGQLSYTGSYDGGQGRTLNVQSGSSATFTGNLGIGTFIDTGTVNVDGVGSTLTTNTSIAGDSSWGVTNGTANVTISNSAIANINSTTLHLSDDGLPSSSSTVNVNSSAQLNVKNLRVGGGSAGTASLTVTGSGSAVTQAAGSTLVVGGTSTSTGNLNINSSSTFNTSNGGITINPTGTINIIGGGTFIANADITIDGGKLIRNAGIFSHAPGKNLTASNNAEVNLGTSYGLSNGRTFTIQSGSLLTLSDYLDVAAGSNATLTITGTNSKLIANSSNSGFSQWGSNNGIASVTISSGATATIGGEVVFGKNLNGKCDITVSGSGSSFTQTGANAMTLGGTGTATSSINVNSGTSFSTGTGSVTINPTGTVNITSGTFNANGNVTLDGGKILRSGNNSAFNLAANKTLTASNNGLFQVTDQFMIINNGTNFTFNSGADLIVSNAFSYVDVGDTTAGTLVVTGTGSSLLANSRSFWGTAGGTGTVTIGDNATATMNSGFEVCESTVANTSGTLNILSGATLTSNNNVRIGVDGATGGSGFANVNGGTFSIVGATRSLIIGHATTGTAQLSVSGSGTFNTDGPTTINATGTLGNGFGTINAKAVTNNGNFNSSSTTNVTSLNGTGTLTVNSGTFSSQKGITQNTATLTFGGVIDIAPNGGADGVSVIKNLSYGANGYFNLHDNDLIIDYTGGSSTYTHILNKVKSGLTLLSGTGNGIGSTEVDAQTVAGTILAVVDSGDPALGGGFTSISGFTVANPGSSVLVKYTWFGDCNLDGVVDGSDYALIDTGFTSGGSLTGWVFGDVDYNGFVQAGDYALADTGFIAQTGTLPEPGMLGLVGLGLLLMKRRRKNPLF